LLTCCAGFGQFGTVAALGAVAKAFGHVTHGSSIADRAGLSGTEIGIGLAVLRLASLAALPMSAVADRVGRRSVVISSCGLGLVCTAVAAASPSFWWFVAIFAVGRPLLSTTSAVAQVGAAEISETSGRAGAIALVTAGYGLGAGITAIIYDLGEGALGFRGVFALALGPAVALFFVRRRVVEPERFVTARAANDRAAEVGRRPVLGAIDRGFRARLGIVTLIGFFTAMITGPGTSFVFLYAENILGVSGGVAAVMVVVAAAFGLLGLWIGRAAANRFGRRPTGALAMVALAVTAILTYSGSRAAVVVGYELQILSAAMWAPAAGALSNELFPTSIRTSVAGWTVAASVLGASVGLLVFGAVADVGNRFATGALVTSLPGVLVSCAFVLLPETLGRELDELWPAQLTASWSSSSQAPRNQAPGIQSSGLRATGTQAPGTKRENAS